MIAHVPCLENSPTSDFALDAQTPLVRLLRFKVGRNTGVIEAPRVENPCRQISRKQRTNIRPGRIGWQLNPCGGRAGKCVEQGYGSGRSDIGIDVVERRVIRDAVAAANDRFSIAGEFAAEPRSPGKTHGRSPTILRRIERREGGDGKGQLWVEKGIRSGLIRSGQLIEEVCRLTVIGPIDSQIQGKVFLYFKVVSEVKESVLLSEIEVRISRGNSYSVGVIISQGSEIGKAKATVQVRQKGVRRALVSKVDAGLQRMASDEVAPVVLKLIVIDDTALRCGRCRSKRQELGIVESHLRKSVSNVSLIRNRIADRVSAKLDVQSAVTGPEFVGHAAGNGSNPAKSIVLRKCRHVHWITRRGCDERISIEKCRAIKEIASREMILASLNVEPNRKVIGF